MTGIDTAVGSPDLMGGPDPDEERTDVMGGGDPEVHTDVMDTPYPVADPR